MKNKVEKYFLFYNSNKTILYFYYQLPYKTRFYIKINIYILFRYWDPTLGILLLHYTP